MKRANNIKNIFFAKIEFGVRFFSDRDKTKNDNQTFFLQKRASNATFFFHRAKLLGLLGSRNAKTQNNWSRRRERKEMREHKRVDEREERR